MALFQILRGKAANLAGKAFHDGYAYLTPDDGAFYIDAETDGEQKRIHINPKPDLQEIAADEVQSAWDSYPPPPCLTFSSPNSFTVNVATPGWDETMEYSTDKSTWATWDGSQVTAVDNGGTYALYFRGIGNTKVAGSTSNKWTLTGANIACNGNIESLLDYATVAAGNHPSMASKCYYSMFDGCTSLTTAPALPATAMTDSCYFGMFNGCTSLANAPELPATTLASVCYYYMFNGCTSLTTAPALPAKTLAEGCYYSMFAGCTGLTTAPELHAMTLAGHCYSYMFDGCTKLKLSATQTGNYTQAYRIPTSGTGTTASSALDSMFANTGGTFTGTPTINTTYYLDASNTIV